LSFDIFIMPPAVVFVEDDFQVQSLYERGVFGEDRPVASGGEDWDEELLVPSHGRMVYVGQGESQFTFFDQPAPGLLYPKRKKKKKKTATPQLPPPPELELEPLSPAPIDWGDWEEICQLAPPPVPAPVGEDWESEIYPPWQPEDWDAEIAASQDREDWDAEIAASQ
jgi:hypothetical protein